MPNDNEEQVVLKGEAHKVVTKSPETTTGPFDWVPQLFGQISNFFLQKKPSPKQDCLSSNCSELLSKLILKFKHADENDNNYVVPSNFHFLVGQKTHVSGTVGQGFGITVTVFIVYKKGKKPSTSNLTYKWQVKPIGNQSGTVTPPTETGPSCSFIPQVTAAQRSFSQPSSRALTGWKRPSDPISYEVSVTVSCKNTTDSRTISATITQDCRDIIRQEYLDFLMFLSGFNIPIPTRTEIVSPISGSPFNSNNNYAGCENGRGLVVNRGMIGLYNNILARYQQYCGNACTIHIESSWRCPRRNRKVDGAVNSNHQKGTAMDLQPQPGNMSNFIKLYRAASVYANAEVILEWNAIPRLPKNHQLPQPSKADPDLDGDGFPDSQLETEVRFEHRGHIYKNTYKYAFSHASHVHAAVN